MYSTYGNIEGVTTVGNAYSDKDKELKLTNFYIIWMLCVATIVLAIINSRYNLDLAILLSIVAVASVFISLLLMMKRVTELTPAYNYDIENEWYTVDATTIPKKHKWLNIEILSALAMHYGWEDRVIRCNSYKDSCKAARGRLPSYSTLLRNRELLEEYGYQFSGRSRAKS